MVKILSIFPFGINKNITPICIVYNGLIEYKHDHTTKMEKVEFFQKWVIFPKFWKFDWIH